MKKLPAQQVSGLVHVLVCLSVRPSVRLFHCLSACLPVQVSVCFGVSLSVCLFRCLLICLFHCPSACLFYCPFHCLSVCVSPSACPSVCLSVSPFRLCVCMLNIQLTSQVRQLTMICFSQ